MGFLHTIQYPPPFYRNFSDLTPSREHYNMAPILFLSFSFLFVGLAKYVCILPLRGGGGPTADIQYNKGPIPFSRLLKAREMCAYKSYSLFQEAPETYPISREFGLKTPLSSFFLEKIFPRQTAKNTPFPEKM